ncbi:ABC transporter ATP-binding protein [Falsiroseomonas oryzae]|uniref:ABC transporter ATP-binding protein n=1 Tax=Falsiroseomonas oryzae TaxID=2766473 RepID=UPI0022EA5996|nr:ABC transporter ATP-binding protein [Roseomonas sp. MO-31]
MAGAPLLSVEGLETHIATHAGTLRAVDGVDLHVMPGEAVALVGESGCGKSMTALSVMRLLRPPARTVAGRVAFEGQDLLALEEAAMRRLRGDRIAMVFQDPMTFLNPLMRVGDQIAEALAQHRGQSMAQARQAAVEALRSVRIPEPATVARNYPHQLSGGMRQRALIAMAVACRPALLVADEPTTALDVTVQAQIMRLLAGLRRDLGSALLLITHDLGLVAEYCDRVYVMYAGQIVEHAEVGALFRAPQHPYTRALLAAALPPHRRVAELAAIEGQPPSLLSPPPGCRFHPRCPARVAPCDRDAPPLFVLSPERTARCWLHARSPADAAAS